MAISEEKEVYNPKIGGTYKFKLNFITLTLPSAQEPGTDRELKRGPLKVWIQKMKRHFGMHDYVWKAEVQENGNLHFHITTNVYIPWQDIRDTWNECLEGTGMIDRFEAKFGHRNPNSTDVHSVRKVKNLAAYMVKYMAKKNEGRRNIEGKVWGCSKNLTGTDRAETLIDSETADLIRDITTQLPDSVKESEHCTFIYLTDAQWKFWITGRYLQLYEEWKKRVIARGRQHSIAKTLRTSKKPPNIRPTIDSQKCANLKDHHPSQS
jgi:hypothetical protein